MNRSYITFEHVWKTYLTGGARVDALRDVSFGVEKGEFTVILGASGAGKTTLLNMLGGMDRITEGKIWLDGREISAMNEKEMVQYRRYDVGFVFQFYNLIPNLTALENVEMAAMLCPDPVPAEVSSSGLPSPGRLPRIRNCCSVTNPPVHWITGPGRRCCRCCMTWAEKTAQPPWSSRTTRQLPGLLTGSSGSARARSKVMREIRTRCRWRK